LVCVEVTSPLVCRVLPFAEAARKGRGKGDRPTQGMFTLSPLAHINFLFTRVRVSSEGSCCRTFQAVREVDPHDIASPAQLDALGARQISACVLHYVCVLCFVFRRLLLCLCCVVLCPSLLVLAWGSFACVCACYVIWLYGVRFVCCYRPSGALGLLGLTEPHTGTSSAPAVPPASARCPLPPWYAWTAGPPCRA